MMSRVLLVCLLVASAGDIGCNDTRPLEEHVLNRIGYGPDSWSRQRIRDLGVNGYIEEQLHPARLDDSDLEGRLRNRYPALTMSLSRLRSYYDGTSSSRSRIYPRQQLTKAKLLRAALSKRQLEQVLVDFWFNHFNVDGRREIAQWAVVPYERDAIRPHVLGRFETMLRAVIRHPAMLEYLDNAQNFREGFVRDGTSYGVNENFGRELLEVHTVGPDAGRSLSDIRNAALAFTGWTVADNLVGDDGRGFRFLSNGHDRSEKRILRLSLPAGQGIGDGNALISYLARHPDTAVHIARKLCRRFVAEEATGCEVAAAARFLATGGDLREVMREILGSQPFRDPRYFRSKVKRPLHAFASVARALGLDDQEEFVRFAISHVARMGEDLYGAAPPIGWPDESTAWLGEGTAIRRINLAAWGAAGTRGMRAPAALGTTDFQAVATALIERYLGVADRATRAEFVRFLRELPSTGRLREGTALVLSTPDFTHH